MARSIALAGNGSPNQGDPYHNEFLDTGGILAAHLKQGLSGAAPVAAGEAAGEMAGDPAAIPSGYNLDQMNAVGEFAGTFNYIVAERIAASLDTLKDELAGMFQKYSSDERTSSELELMIRRVEDVQENIGVEVEPFDPLRNMSGLQGGEPLENAEKVVANTVKHYKLYRVSSINPEMSGFGPAVRISISGVNDSVGFEVDGLISAKLDFNGNEAIDYVFSPDGGLLTVKARTHGVWKDASSDFVINCEVKRYSLKAADEGVYWSFLGEKIVKEGKEKIAKALNINSDDLTFGKCRVFSKDSSVIQKIDELVKVN